MIRAPDRGLTRSDTLLFLGCLGLSAGALALPADLAQPLATGLRESILAPFVWLQRRAAEDRTGRARFRSVQAARDSLALLALETPALRAENERLRALLVLRARVGAVTIPAEVMHQAAPTDGRTLLLGVGRGAGVRQGDAVVAPEGLVGMVLSAGIQTTVAMTWAHPEFRVSGVTEDGSVLGIVAPSPEAGASESFLEFRGVAYRDTVPNGTVVMTSGLGGVYPRGLPLGRVAGVRREELGWERVYRLTPAANPGHQAHVLIYRMPGASSPVDGEPR